ncbi:MAG: BadF/BadG/BcrA/BcrD ATPase family protein [Gemmatimonadaceae bacterium]
MSAIVAGVDGGGTKTKVWIADERGTHLGSADGPGSAVKPGEADRSADVIAAAVRDALASSAMTHVIPKVVCVGVAGAGRDEGKRALWQALSAREIADDIVVYADAAIALDDAFGDGPGILLIGGTGSVAFGRGPTGTPARCGGWGPMCGDEGGGAWIGRRALSVVTAAADGREPETALTGAVLTAAEANEPEQLIAWAANATPGMLASLVPAVITVAESGDLRANAVLSMAAEELVLHLRTLARELFGDERASCPVALAGGLLSPGAALRKRVEQRLRSAVPGAQLRAEEVVPVRGAVRGALRYLGVDELAE